MRLKIKSSEQPALYGALSGWQPWLWEWQVSRMRTPGMAGLETAIQRQFDDWGLTPAEAEIAGLMLKGLSLKDIAGLRRTSEATIRQQAQGVYRKSGLSNRAELSAYFLEDLYDVAGARTVTHSAAPEARPLN